MNYIFTVLALLLAPLMMGIVNQTKAFFAGRKGTGYFRLYFDLLKLLKKSCVRSTTTTWVFDLAPAIMLATTLLAAAIFPWSEGNIYSSRFVAVAFFYLMATGRAFTVLGALDTGSAFEGMGASREVEFSALAEPTIFVILGFMALIMNQDFGQQHIIPLTLIAVAFFAILLSENCRVPFDDPETHLELTMIHEAMILDNSGPDLAFILYASAVKFELLCAFMVSLVIPGSLESGTLQFVGLIAGTIMLAVVVGIVESVMARMRFIKTPQILLGALMLAVLGVTLYVI